MNFENIVIATSDKCFYRKVSALLNKMNRSSVQVCSIGELVSEIKSSEEILVIYDVFFLGDKAKIFVSTFKQLNENSHHLMCILGRNKTIFALRLKAIGFDGVIENIRNTKNFEDSLKKFFSTNSYFTSDVERELSCGLYLNKKPQTTEITVNDELIFMQLLEGLTPQEIDREHPKNVSNRIQALLDKCGVETMFELQKVLNLY